MCEKSAENFECFSPGTCMQEALRRNENYGHEENHSNHQHHQHNQHSSHDVTHHRCNDGHSHPPMVDVPEPPIKHNPPGFIPNCRPSMLDEYQKVDASQDPPCYIPKDDDCVPDTSNITDRMGPIGPWATGKVDWTPLGGITGIRPVVDRYSVTRFSTKEWCHRNKDIVDKSYNAYQCGLHNEANCRDTKQHVYNIVDRTQTESTNQLKDRARLIDNWQNKLEHAIADQIEEISLLEEQRQRLKQALAVLQMPQSIASECLDRRCFRPESELVRDFPEEVLVKELALIAEIRLLLERTLKDVEAQQAENRSARQRLENDWSDKKEAHEIESVNCSLNNTSKTTLFRPGATKFPAEQSSEEFWIHFTKESLDACEHCRQKSINLRCSLNTILMNTARDLRCHADIVEKAFNDRINCMEEARARLENELKECLQKLADIETVIINMTDSLHGLDTPMKVAQARLYNRFDRPQVENCRDHAQYALVAEVDVIQNGISSMEAAIKDAENTKQHLLETRGLLEREIMLKRRTINLDRDRCVKIRSHFPTATALSGYTTI